MSTFENSTTIAPLMMFKYGPILEMQGIYICMALLFYFIFSFNFFEVNFCFILRIKYYTDLFIYVLVFLCYIDVIMDTQVHINRLFLLKQQRQPKSWVRL